MPRLLSNDTHQIALSFRLIPLTACTLQLFHLFRMQPSLPFILQRFPEDVRDSTYRNAKHAYREVKHHFVQQRRQLTHGALYKFLLVNQ